MDKSQNLYEIAYLVSPAYSAEEAQNFQQTVKNHVQALGGFIDHEGELLKRRLFYPIKKMAEAYAAGFRFTLGPEKIGELESRLKAPQVLRSMIVHTKRQPARTFRPRIEKVSDAERPKLKHAIAVPKPEQPKLESAADIEEIDKKLEEILGK
ncbi:MAG: 30S ribosomal protein S6 [Candidatus Giovannonibacteria bacterium]|nr:MAG: 30S ribosomal protein S6 [Candidatus Giovannonibacteria bacterium]